MAVTINGDTGIDKVVDNTITTDDIQDGAITAAKIASGAIPNSYAGTKNLIINGNMQIAQRGTSSSSYSTGDTYLTLDRWRSNIVSSGTWTMSQDTDVPTGQGFASSMKWDCTTANASLPTNAFMYTLQSFEGQNLQQLKKGTSNAEPVTLSFWVKSNKTGTYTVFLYDIDNTRLISKAYTVDVADTWEKKTITYAGDTTGALDNNNGRSLDVRFMLASGTDWSSGTLQTSWAANVTANRAVGQVNLADSTSNYINITGVQLETGTTATDFENLPYDVSLARCQRYFQKAGSGGSSGWVITSTDIQIAMPTYVTTLRALPTISLTGNNVYIHSPSNIADWVPTLVSQNMGTTGGKCRLGGATGLTASQPFITFSVDVPVINLDSEL